MKARIYDDHDCVYRIDGSYIYRSGGGYYAYRIDGNYIYKSGGGYYVYRIDGNLIYDTDGNYVYRIDGNYIYKSGDGHYVYRIESEIDDSTNAEFCAREELYGSTNGGFGVRANSSGSLWGTLGIGLVLFVIVGLMIVAWPTFFEQLLNAEDRGLFFTQLFYLFLLILSHIISIVVSVKKEEFSFKSVWLRTVEISLVCAGGGYWLFYTIF